MIPHWCWTQTRKSPVHYSAYIDRNRNLQPQKVHNIDQDIRTFQTMLFMIVCIAILNVVSRISSACQHIRYLRFRLFL